MLPGTTAPDKGIEAFYSMDQALFNQKIQCAINGRRLCGMLQRFDTVQQLIGFDCFVAVLNQFQHLVTNRC